MNKIKMELEVEIEKLITETRLSRVYKARLGDTKLVIKIPTEGKEENLGEAIKIYELLGDHENLHKLMSRAYINGKTALLLKYFEGKNITEKIDEIKGDFNKTLKVLYQFLNVVEHIKSKGVFYLDDFIRNTMIDENLQLKLGDFNFSKINEEIETLKPSADVIIKSNITLSTIEEYEKIDRVHIGDFIYFLFTGITPNQRYNKPIQEINKKLKRELLIEVDKIIGKFWYSKEDFKISDIINEFKNLEIKYGSDWEATNKKTKKRIKKSKGVKKSDNIEGYKKLVLEHPFNRENHENLVKSLLKGNRMLEGINFYNELLKDSKSVYNHLSLLYLVIKSPEEERLDFLGEVNDIVSFLKLEENSRIFQELKDDFYNRNEFFYPDLHQHIGFSIAEVLVENKQFKDALGIYNILSKDGFDDIYLYYKKGSLLEKMEKLDKALEFYKKGVESYLKEIIPIQIGKELNESFVRISEKVGKLGEAKKFYEELISKEPKPVFYSMLIKILKIRKERGELERVCREAIDRYPEIADFYGELGILLSSEFRKVEALTMLEKAFEKKPSDVTVSKELAKIYMADGEDFKAKKVLESTLISNPENPELYYMLARVAIDTNDFESAENYLKKSIDLGINDRKVYYEYGDILLRNNKSDDAIKIYNKMKELFPEDIINVYKRMKVVYSRKGELNKVFEIDGKIRELKLKKSGKAYSSKLKEFGKSVKKYIGDALKEVIEDLKV